MQLIQIPKDDGFEALDAGPGDVIVVLGANGTGKSSLLQDLFVSLRPRAKRITAHRQTWMKSSALSLSAQNKVQMDQQLSYSDAKAPARWSDPHAEGRVNKTLFELIDGENSRALRITAEVDSDADFDRTKHRNNPGPLKILNRLLRLGNLPVRLSVGPNQELLAHRNGGTQYSAAEMSDGERSAVLLAADVLMAGKGFTILIDEPDRHLHPSIATPLLTALFAHRRDCRFVVSTHDVSLPISIRPEATVLLRSCTRHDARRITWDFDVVDKNSAQEVPEDVREAIMGSRRTILFAEGTDDSVDRHTYAILFPHVSVVPLGGCENVIRSVAGLVGAGRLHWLSVFGLIDSDGRTKDELSELETQSVFAVDGCSIESLYYCTDTMRRIVADWKEARREGPADVEGAMAAILDGISANKHRLCAMRAERKVRHEVLMRVPNHKALQQASAGQIEYDPAGHLSDEHGVFDSMVQEKDVDGLVGRYAIRTTGALEQAAQKLGFGRREVYEDAVRKLLVADEDARQAMRARLRRLTDAIEAAQER